MVIYVYALQIKFSYVNSATVPLSQMLNAWPLRALYIK